MKGIVFSEMLEFLDRTGGPLFAEQVLADADLPHGGAYSRVALYPWEEAVRIVEAAARASGTKADELCQAFGRFLFERFTILYADIVQRYPSAEALLTHVGGHIHEEVRVIYPDARPPAITTRTDSGDLIVEYASHRPFAHIAHGLVAGAMKHFGDTRRLEWLHASDDGSRAAFVLVRSA
ncbi:heme NO-binding domain-containing protein [Alteriqipengyuania sp. 357]